MTSFQEISRRSAGFAAPQGLWLPLITPFRDGALDTGSLRRLLRHYAEQPLDGLILAGTTGEAMTLDEAETELLVRVGAEEIAGRLPLYLGLSGSDTWAQARQLAMLHAWPVDGYLIACPYYTRPSQEGLYHHFAALAAETDRPILLYNIPYRTGVNLANETLLRLAERGNIRGVKDCCDIYRTVADERWSQYSDYPGDARVAAFVALSLGWQVFAVEHRADVLAPVYSAAIRMGVFLAVFLALAVAASAMLARRMVRPITAIEAGARRIGEGALDERIELDTGDELESLGDAFNRMAGQLHELYDDLERRVEDRTRDLRSRDVPM